MAGDSAHAGYLRPLDAPAPFEDEAFENFLHDIFVGLTGLDGKLVVPRWQQEPPTQQERPENWIAFGVMRMYPDTYGVEQHSALGEGSSDLQRHETVEVLISSYGPNAAAILASLRDGLQIEQNRAVLAANAMGLQETGDMIPSPQLVKEKWLRKLDMSFIFRRQIRRTYTVYSLASAHGTLNTEKTQTPINVVPQTP